MKLASHIQKIAPGPPNPIAVATPTIFPAPIVPARAVETASKGEIEFSSDFESLTSLPKAVSYTHLTLPTKRIV